MPATIQVVSRKIADFDSTYQLVQLSQDVERILNFIGMPTEAVPAFLFILRDDAGSELLEVWGAANNAPGARAHRLA